MVNLNTLKDELGILVRDAIRLNATVLAFNPTVTAQNWIFWLRPKSLQGEFKVPRCVIEPIDDLRENWTTDNQKQVFIPMDLHAWVDQDQAINSVQLGEALGAAVQILDGTNGIHEIETIGFSNVSEPEDKRVLTHIVTRIQIDWRQIGE